MTGSGLPVRSRIWRGPERAATLAAVGLGLVLWALTAAWLQIEVLGIGLLDNGDGFRVLDKALVPRRLPGLGAGVGIAESYPMMPSEAARFWRVVPDSLAGLIALVIGVVARLGGAERVSLDALTAVYHLIYAAGAAALLASLSGALRWVAAAVLAAVLLCPLTLGYFRSLYEEAAAIALLPLWTAAALHARHAPWGTVAFAAVTAAMVYAKPSLLLVVMPASAAILAGGWPIWRWVVVGILVAVVAVGLVRNQIRYGELNATNRVMTAIPYTLAGVSGWEARMFHDRLAEAPSRLDPEAARRAGLSAEATAALTAGVYPRLRQMDPQRRVAIAAEGSAARQIGGLLARPGLGLRLAAQACLTALRADYRLAYLLAHRLPQPASAVLAHAGWLFAAVAVGLGLALLRGRWLAAAFLLPPTLAPIFVVLADGYYEFEKHLLPFLLLGLFAALPALGLAGRAGAAAAELPLDAPDGAG